MKIATFSVFASAICSLASARPMLSSNALQLVPRALSVDDPSLPDAVKTVCEGGLDATTIVSSAPLSGGSDVVVTSGTCRPSNSSAVEPSSSPAPPDTPSAAPSFSLPSPVVRPSCPVAQNDCSKRFALALLSQGLTGHGYVAKCGAACNSVCYPGTNPPDPNDCEHIVQGLLTETPPLLKLEPNQFKLFSYRNCGIGVQNQIASSSIGCSQVMIYDNADIAYIAHYLAWNCQAAQGGVGGKCTGTTGLYNPQVSDFYVQVWKP